MFDFSYTLLKEEHLEWACELHNDHSTLFELTDVEHVTQLQQKAWYTTISNSKSSKRFVIEYYSIPIGIFRIDNIDYKNKSVMVGLDIDQKYRGLGYSYQIYEYFLDYYFNQVNMNRIYLKVLETNLRAKHIYEKIGFVVEGVERKAIFRNGKYNDYICMSILRDEYVKRKEDSNRDSVI